MNIQKILSSNFKQFQRYDYSKFALKQQKSAILKNSFGLCFCSVYNGKLKICTLTYFEARNPIKQLEIYKNMHNVILIFVTIFLGVSLI